MGKSTFTRTTSQAKIQRLLELINSKPLTAPEIAEKLHMSIYYVRVVIKHLHETRQIRIHSWTRAEVAGKVSRIRPRMIAGEGKDATCRLKAFTDKEKDRRYYVRLMADPAAYSAYLAAARHRERMKKFKPRPDIAAAWLFGKAA